MGQHAVSFGCLGTIRLRWTYGRLLEGHSGQMDRLRARELSSLVDPSASRTPLHDVDLEMSALAHASAPVPLPS